MSKGCRYRWRGIPVVPSVLAVLLFAAACIFDSEPSELSFPGTLEAVISFEGIGSPVYCSCTDQGGRALVSTAGKAVVIDILDEEVLSVNDTGVSINDISDTYIDDYGYVLTDDHLYPVDMSSGMLLDPIHTGPDCQFMSVSAVENSIWIVCGGNILKKVDPGSQHVEEITDKVVEECQGIAASPDGNILFLADGSRIEIVAYDTGSWNEIGACPLSGDVIDLFQGAQGYICAIVENSNELWYIRSENCNLYKMITFPVVPVAAASMPDGSFGYGSCQGIGLTVVSESGEIELSTSDYGLPDAMDISGNGKIALLCSADDESVYILVR